MEPGDWISIAIAATVMLFGAGGFWLWVRKLSVQIRALEVWVGQIEKRQDRQTDDMSKTHDKIGEVHERVNVLVAGVGRLEGKMDLLIGGSGRVQT